MRIAFCTPLHVQSAIGRVSISVADELTRRGHVVTLINIERDPSPAAHSSAQTQVSWKDPHALTALRGAGVIIVQIGDNYDYHAGAIHILHNFRCTSIFHDANIYNLFRMWAFDERSNAEGAKVYEVTLRRVYGDDLDLQLDDPSQHQRFNMLRWLATQCCSALVHANFYKESVQEFCPGLVMNTPLTYDARSNSTVDEKVSSSSLVVLTLGHINSNKCCDQVIEAIGRSDLRARSEYRIVGQVSQTERDRLAAIALQYNVQVAISGRVTDAEIASELQHADIVCCLRRPILEGASASAIESMLFEKPVIVPNAGFYAEIDDSAVIKVSPDFTVDEISTALEQLAQDEEFRRAVARRGKNWATRNCSVQSYVDKLENAMASAVLAEPYLELSSTYASQLKDLGFGRNDALFFEVADCLQSLCEADQTDRD